MKNDEISSLNVDDALKGSVSTESTDTDYASLDNQKNVVRNSLVAGSAAGIASTLAVHPFDVLRVKMQSSAPAAVATVATTSSKTLGLMGTLRNTVYHGGVRGLYTGLAMPLVAQAIYKGTIFTVNNSTESFIREWKTRKTFMGRLETPYKLTLTDRFFSGFMGGAINAALFCTPVEYVRNQQIAQIENSTKTIRSRISKSPGSVASNQTEKRTNAVREFQTYNKNGPIAVIRRTIQCDGLIGLWRGMGSTVLRDSVGCGFFFVAMAYSQEKLKSAFSDRPPQNTIMILSGALAGVSFWLWALPVDTMKTWIQNGTALDLSDAVRISQSKGLARSIPSLFRGWQVAYSRGAPSAAITCFVFQTTFQSLQELP